MKSGIGLIANERQEQITKHQQSILDDVNENPDGRLVNGAIRLLRLEEPPEGWDIDRFNKMKSKSRKERIIIAGALLAAELDRIIHLEKH